MKRFPIELARYFEHCGVRPEEKWRLALYRVNVRLPSVNDLVRHDGIHRLTVNWLGMDQGWKANHYREENDPKRSEAKSPRPMSWHTHHCANKFPGVLRL
jgi:hypothetical protein